MTIPSDRSVVVRDTGKVDDSDQPFPDRPLWTAGQRLLTFEEYWRDHQPWLKERGYQLRARYQAGWVASWSTTGGPRFHREDGQMPLVSNIVSVLLF